MRPLETTKLQNNSEAPSAKPESVLPLALEELEEDTVRNSAQSLNALQRAEYLLDRILIPAGFRQRLLSEGIGPF